MRQFCSPGSGPKDPNESGYTTLPVSAVRSFTSLLSMSGSIRRNLTYQNRDVVEIDSGEGAVPGLYSLQDVPGLGGIRRLGGERLKVQ